MSEYQVFTEGTDAVVECPAFLGDPPGEMYWFRNDHFVEGDRFIPDNGKLTIRNVGLEDADIYICSLYHNGCQGETYITVDVQRQNKSAPVIAEPQIPILVEYDQPLDLVCQLVARQNNVQYSWTIDTSFEQNHLANRGPRLHKEPNNFFGGRYTCRAENQYGFDEKVFFVKILGESVY